MPRRCLLRAEKRVRVTDETFSKWRLQRDSLGFQYDDEYAQYLLRVGESLQKMNMLDQKEGAGGSTTADVGLESSRNEDEPRDANSPTELETDDMSQSGDETNSDNDNHESPEVTQTSIKAFKRTLAPPREGKNNDNSYSARKLDLGWCTAEYDRQQVLSGITDQRRFVAHLLNSHNQWCSTCRTSAATLTASSMAQEKSDFAASNPELKIPTSWESKKWFEDLNAHSNMSITSFLLHLLLIYSHWHSIPLPGELTSEVTMSARTATGELEKIKAEQSGRQTHSLEYDDTLTDAGYPHDDTSFNILSSENDAQKNLPGPSHSLGYDSSCWTWTGTNSLVKKEVADLVNALGLVHENPESGYSEGLVAHTDTQAWSETSANKEVSTIPMDSTKGKPGLKPMEVHQFCAGSTSDELSDQKDKMDTDMKHLHEIVKKSVKELTHEQTGTCSLKPDAVKLPKRKRGRKKLGDRSANVVKKKTVQLVSDGADDVKISCTICEKILTSASKHKDHMKKHAQRLHCSYCDFAIDPQIIKEPNVRRATMKNHRKHKHPEHFQQSLCDICGRGFTDEKGLNFHKVDMHNFDNAALRRKCRKCDAEFPSRSGLASHMARFHPQNIPCTHNGCDKIFATTAGLNTHVRNVHIKLKKYVCKYEGCDGRFVQSGHLKNHIRQVHLQLREFACTFAGCTKVFCSAYNLTVHKRIHSNDKPLKCPHCDYHAAQRNSMNWHMKKHAALEQGEGTS